MSIKLTVRPWSDMFATHSFSLPKNADMLAERIRVNLNYWLTNYLVIMSLFVIAAGYFFNGLLVAGGLAVAGAAFATLTKDMHIEVGGMVITMNHKYGVTALLSLISLWWSETFQPLLVTLSIAGLLALVHAAARTKIGIVDKAKSGIDTLAKDIKDELKTK